MLLEVPPSCHFKLAWMLLCLTVCAWVYVDCYSPPVVFQYRLQWSEFLQWHSSVGQFRLSFSSGVPGYPGVFAGLSSGIPVYNQWHSSGIPVYTGPASVQWLRVRVYIRKLTIQIISIFVWKISAMSWCVEATLTLSDNLRYMYDGEVFFISVGVVAYLMRHLIYRMRHGSIRYSLSIYVYIIPKNIRYLRWNRGAWHYFRNT